MYIYDSSGVYDIKLYDGVIYTIQKNILHISNNVANKLNFI